MIKKIFAALVLAGYVGVTMTMIASKLPNLK
jgi:hypothetical protein